jgi:hypothetical protein
MMNPKHFESSSTELSKDPRSKVFVKYEEVQVQFARESGRLESLEGGNVYAAGDAILSGATGEKWVVVRERFDAKYEPIPPTVKGADGMYKNKPVPVTALQVGENFTVKRDLSGDMLHGSKDDWIVQYGPGDLGIVKDERFKRVYREVPKS